MSRIGRMPITIPAGVEIKSENNVITVKGPKGSLTNTISPEITVKSENGILTLARSTDRKDVKAKHGLYRALINNMITGVTKGFQKSLIVNGVGYKSAVQGNKLTLNIGYSHPVEFIAPAGIALECVSPTEIVVKGIDKHLVGQVAADIRSKREVEPYHAYGIRYKDEVVLRKEGKAAGKGK